MDNLPSNPNFQPPVPVQPVTEAELVPVQDQYEPELDSGSSTTILHVFLVALRRWGLLTVPAGLTLAVGAVALVWWTYKPIYEASAWFQVLTDNTIVDFTKSDHSVAYAQFVQTQVELVRSPLVLGPVIQNPEIAGLEEVREQESPIDWLKQNVKVLAVGQSEFLQINFRTADKETARKIVDAISQQYLQVYRQESTLRQQQEIELLQQEKDRQAAEIAIHRDKVRTLHRQTYGKDPFVVQRENVGVPASSDEFADALHRMMMEAVVKKELLETNLRAITSQLALPAEITDEQIDARLADDEKLAQLRQSLQQKEAQLGRLLASPQKVANDPLASASDEDDPVKGADRRRLTRQLQGEIDQLATQVTQWEQLRRDQVREDLELAAYREVLVERAPKASPDAVRPQVDSDPEVLRLTAQLEEQRREIEKYRELLNSQKDHAALRRLVTDYKNLQKKLDDYRQRLTDHYISIIEADALQQHLAGFDQLVAEVHQARAHHNVLSQKLAATTTERVEDVERVGEETIDLEFARQALEQAMEMHQLLAQQLVQLKTEARAPDRVMLRQAATVSNKPVDGLPIRNMILAAMVALAVPCGLATLWEWSVKRVSNADQFAMELGIPVLGEITRLPGTQRATFSSVSAEMNRAAVMYEQSTLVLSDNISHSSHLRNVKVMAVSSAVKGEGKSHVAVKLAVNLARVMPGKVLLVDGDIRFRSVERLLGISGNVGLADALHGKMDVRDVVQELADSGLHVIAAGMPGQRSYDLLRNGVLPGMFQQLRERYKYIIIDTPPILSAGESLSFGKVADGTLICALRDISRIPQTRKALARLLAVGVRPLGAILAGVPASKCEAAYYGYAPSLEPPADDEPGEDA